MITYKHRIYELSHESLNDLGFRILGNEDILRKCLNSHRMITQFFCQDGTFFNTSKKALKK